MVVINKGVSEGRDEWRGVSVVPGHSQHEVVVVLPEVLVLLPLCFPAGVCHLE